MVVDGNTTTRNPSELKKNFWLIWAKVLIHRIRQFELDYVLFLKYNNLVAVPQDHNIYIGRLKAIGY